MSTKRSFLAVVFGLMVAAAAIFLPWSAAVAAVTDNMYKTANTGWECSSGNSNDFRDNGNYCQTDNESLTVHLTGSLTAGSKASVRAAMDRYDHTDLNVTEDSSPAYSGSSETDVIVEQQVYGFSGTLIGYAWCDDAISSWRCDQHYVRFRYDDIPSALACHELGHAVGLTHGQNANPKLDQSDSRLNCLVTPLENDLKYVSSNNSENINATY